jgi:hypothetical protein
MSFHNGITNLESSASPKWSMFGIRVYLMHGIYPDPEHTPTWPETGLWAVQSGGVEAQRAMANSASLPILEQGVRCGISGGTSTKTSGPTSAGPTSLALMARSETVFVDTDFTIVQD